MLASSEMLTPVSPLKTALADGSGAGGLHRQNLRLGNLRRFGKKILGFGEERLGNFTVQVGVAAVLVGKSIEDAVFSRSQLYCVPAEGRRFALGQRLRRLQKFLHLFFFPWFRFQLCPNGESAHGCCLLSIRCAAGSFGDRPGRGSQSVSFLVPPI